MWNVLRSLFACRWPYCLLCVSEASATEFSAILFLLFARSSSNSPGSFERFRRTLRAKFQVDSTTDEVFPHKPPLLKLPAFGNVITLPIFKADIFLQRGSLAKILTRCRIWVKFGTRVRLKPNNIAEISIALGHETHNRFSMLSKYHIMNILNEQYQRDKKYFVHTFVIVCKTENEM